MLSTAEVASAEAWGTNMTVENIELICMIGDSNQVSVRLSTENAGVAETQFSDFVERLGAKVGEIYAKYEETPESEEQEQPNKAYPH